MLDMCAGSGDLVNAWLSHAKPDRVIGLDFSYPMLEQAKTKIHDPRVVWLQGDGEQLPFQTASIHALTIGFGLRNLIDMEVGMREMRRVLREGGCAVVLELTRPTHPFLKMTYRPYLNWYVPAVGRLISGNAAACRYLRDTINSFAEPEEIRSKFYGAGFQKVEIRSVMGGIATLIKAVA